VLAQGLAELGYTNLGNINYWKDFGADYLIQESHIPIEMKPVAIFSSWFVLNNSEKIPELLQFFSSNFLLDQEDGGEVTSCENYYHLFSGVLRCHFNRTLHNQKNVFPWMFGITNHMIDWLDKIERIDSGIVQTNFRVKHETRVKGLAILKKRLPNTYKFLEKFDFVGEEYINGLTKEQLHYFEMTKLRCLPSYLIRLKSSMIAPAFGGWFYDRSVSSIRRLVNKILFRANLRIPKTYALVNYDSWRFWECMFSGVPTVHFDLERYSACLPVQPINGIHYIGLDLKGNVNGEKLSSVLKRKEMIGMAGKEFVKQNYSPKAIASLFLSIL